MHNKRYLTVIPIMCFLLFSVTAFAGEIIVKGSTSVRPILQSLATAYMTENPDVQISVSGGGSGDGISALLKGDIDIASSSRFLKDREKEDAVYDMIYPVPFAIAHDCVVPIVHPSNPVDNLTVTQLKDIYRGRISNWKYLGGPDKGIVVVSRNRSSGTYDVWENEVMDEKIITRFALYEDSNSEVVTAVSLNRYAIGYISLSYMDESVRGLSVNGITASDKTAIDGSFPVNRPLYLFTKGWPSGDILDFINFVLHPDKGQACVNKAGVAPLYSKD